jgi:hypothetical protein
MRHRGEIGGGFHEIFRGLDGEVSMVGRDTLRGDADRVPPGRLDHDAAERLERGLAKRVRSSSGPVRDLIRHPARSLRRCSRHVVNRYLTDSDSVNRGASRFPSSFSIVPTDVAFLRSIVCNLALKTDVDSGWGGGYESTSLYTFGKILQSSFRVTAHEC